MNVSIQIKYRKFCILGVLFTYVREEMGRYSTTRLECGQNTLTLQLTCLDA